MTDYYYDLGSCTRLVSTGVGEAQTWFDRGLVWSYAFNHEEAIDCFERARELDPECAMAFWGIAYALGPNYNKPWERFDPADLESSISRAFEASARAERLAHRTTPVERALIGALRQRYPQPEAAPDLSVWNHRYAEAMRLVHAEHPDDLDVIALFADALLNLTPWQLWDQWTGEPSPGSFAVEARAALDHALGLPGGPDHPGVLHMYIHLMEMSSVPEQALPMADRLRDLVPDAGHLQHMPTHLDVLCGDYSKVVSSNARAIEADGKFVTRSGPMNFYTLYRCHNFHFKIYGSMFLGQRAAALHTCSELEAAVPEELLRVRVPPMADWLEGLLSMRMHVLIRFGMWREIIDAPLPGDPELYCVTTAMMHYAKAVAHAASGRVETAQAQRALFEEAVGRVPESRTLFNNTCRDILAVAAAMLEGEMEYRKGNIDEAFAALRRSIELDDNLPYDEPWGWMQPTRHAYGALLLEQGHVEEAAAVYRADLGLDGTVPRSQQHPGNVWGLHGLHECLVRQGHRGEASLVEQQLRFAQARADVSIHASCFCRQSAVGPSPSGTGSAGHCH
ncbi:tetratricopeptide repeat protein [Streptomyces sp. A73]|uniref:tetratricopeptide repeat protein n=1 Tax=Streptomyces sp. RK75 TaxID=2824895 RepID=UPI0016176FB2|nr:tetratricopeptide repeat protein [Streptomyces sp. RK75]MBQ0865904.1 tetratricopeptide repeat protein [Streptomyces sp. RK75]MBQ1160586.1 tetratricopeptide repeat protein [Streptomyces sp. A73]